MIGFCITHNLRKSALFYGTRFGIATLDACTDCCPATWTLSVSQAFVYSRLDLSLCMLYGSQGLSPGALILQLGFRDG